MVRDIKIIEDEELDYDDMATCALRSLVMFCALPGPADAYAAGGPRRLAVAAAAAGSSLLRVPCDVVLFPILF
jgi:hypothetical protein